jgi:AcrR family transcriptional regulator
MPTLRERQKKARRKQILDAARHHFLEDGYSKTNMETIAETAQVGVATVYTYFTKKEGIVSELIYQDFTEVSNNSLKKLDQLPQDPAEAIIEVLASFRDFDSYMSYELVLEFMQQAQHQGPVREAVQWSRSVIIGQISSVLEKCAASDKLSRKLDIQTASEIIAILNEQHLRKLSRLQHSERNHDSLNNQIVVLFENWSA